MSFVDRFEEARLRIQEQHARARSQLAKQRSDAALLAANQHKETCQACGGPRSHWCPEMQRLGPRYGDLAMEAIHAHEDWQDAHEDWQDAHERLYRESA